MFCNAFQEPPAYFPFTVIQFFCAPAPLPPLACTVHTQTILNWQTLFWCAILL
jgi:hypothetical protein